jgi:sigma-B regulation protein RsbU (phosphoserine phosphatase)
MAGCYVPATGSAGGDWYDVFILPSGQVCAVIGDVAGKGPGAAAIMGRTRGALRAHARQAADPADLLGRLNSQFLSSEPDSVATALCAVFDRDLNQVRLSSAGHPPPVLAVPGRPPQTAAVDADLLLGMSDHGGRRTRTFAFPPGALLCLYTDGLVERRGQILDEGIARLCAATTASRPEAACGAVMSAMASGAPPQDDLALLMIRRPPRQAPHR